MISFYPGPSKVWDALPEWMQDAYTSGIVSVNHRSPEFIALSEKCIGLLKEKLHIPASYQIFFTSSATECWEIIAQSVLQDEESLHLYNGAFGEKWQQYTQKITGRAMAVPFGLNELPVIPDHSHPTLIALTQNETSNGTQLPVAFLQQLRSQQPEPLIAVDATSSLGGIALPMEAADIWFASVQKCLGLPAGLGLLICSPRTLAVAEKKDENRHYNSLNLLKKHMENWQTSYTPNVLGIYLLSRALEAMPDIEKTYALLHRRYLGWNALVEELEGADLLGHNPETLSETVLALQASPELVERIKKAAREKGFYLGNGYGQWKESSFRIANFPALTEDEVNSLQDFLEEMLY